MDCIRWVFPGLAKVWIGMVVGLLFCSLIADVEAETASAPSVEAWKEAQIELEEGHIALRKLLSDHEELKALLMEKNIILSSLKRELAVAQTELELFRQKWADMELSVRHTGVNLLSLSEARLKNQVVECAKELEEKRQEIEWLKQSIAKLEGDAGATDESSADPEESTRQRMAETDPRPESEGKSSGETGIIKPRKEGRVTGIERKLKLVALDLGDLDGLRVGMYLKVEREKKPVADVLVIEVRNSICAALIQKKYGKLEPLVGDLVRF